MVAPRLNLGGGGAERQTIALANGFAREDAKSRFCLRIKGGPDRSAFKRGQGPLLQLTLEFLFKIPLHLRNRKNRKTRHSLQQVLDNKPAMIFAGRVLGIKTVVAEVSNIKQSLRRWPPVLRNAIDSPRSFATVWRIR